MKARLRLPDKFAGMTQTEREWALSLEAQARSTAILLAGDDRQRIQLCIVW